MGGKLKLHDCLESKSAISAASLYEPNSLFRFSRLVRYNIHLPLVRLPEELRELLIEQAILCHIETMACAPLYFVSILKFSVTITRVGVVCIATTEF